MRSSAKHIQSAEIKEIHDEIESSVSYFRMQTMNQSLIALLANGAITYEAAKEQSPDSDDLSLKLRKLFPSIEDAQREGRMTPSPADFASIIELTEIKRLYEEQEERWKQRTLDKDERIAQLEAQLAALRQEMSSTGATSSELRNQLEALRVEKERQARDAEGRIEKLNDRIRELNQQISGGAKAPAEKPQSGFFKR
jgi:hypothetical protein